MSNLDGTSIYLLGASTDVVEKARENLEKLFPSVNIVGVHNGYFNKEEEKDVIEEINKLKPNVLFVAMGHPYQEKWIYEHRNELKVDVATGQDGTFEYEAGTLRRAPKFVQKIGMEWFWRLCLEPSRIKRQMALPKFLFKIIFAKDKTKGKFD